MGSRYSEPFPITAAWVWVALGSSTLRTVFTPLTGAAVLDTNAAAGSIWGTYDSRKIIGCKGRDLKVAAMATYGKYISF